MNATLPQPPNGAGVIRMDDTTAAEERAVDIRYDELEVSQKLQSA